MELFKCVLKISTYKQNNKSPEAVEEYTNYLYINYYSAKTVIRYLN